MRKEEAGIALFELQREADLETFRTNAADEETAVGQFARMLNLKLSLVDNNIVPTYWMRRIVPNVVRFVNFDIPIYSQA